MTFPKGKTSAGKWLATNAAQRDTIGSNENLQVGDFCELDDGSEFNCVSVDGPNASTWAADADAGGASTLAEILANSSLTGGAGDNITLQGPDIIQGQDGAPAANGIQALIRGGDFTAGGAGTETGGPLTARAGDSNADGATAQPASTVRAGDQSGTGSADAGSLTVRAGDKTAGGGAGGDLVVRSGESTGTGSSATVGAGTLTSGNVAGTATFHGGDNDDTGDAGTAIVRGGDCVAGAGNNNGGDLGLRSGTSRNGFAGGDIFIRSAGPTGTAASTGDITITTQAVGTTGPFVTSGGASTDTGDITITTDGAGAGADIAGNVNIRAGDTNAVTGNNPGDIDIQAGAMDSTSQASVAGGSVTITGGASQGLSSSAGGAINITAGAQTDTGTEATSPGGNVNITAGASAKDNATSGGGLLFFIGGAATGANGVGGDTGMKGGDASGSAVGARGGAASIIGGDTTGGGNGGDTNMIGGNPTAVGAGGNGGNCNIVAGAPTSGTATGAAGNIQILTQNNPGSGAEGVILIASDAGAVGIQAGGTPAISFNTLTLSAGFAGTVNTGPFNFGLQTTDATTTAVDVLGGIYPTLDTDGHNFKIEAYVTGQLSGGGDIVSFRLISTFYRSAGTVAELVHLTDTQNNGAPGYTAVFNITGDAVSIDVTGAALTTVNWSLKWWKQRGGFAS